GRALHRGVDRRPFGSLPARSVRAVDLRQPAAPAEYGLDVALRLGEPAGLVHVGGHAGIAAEVTLDIGPGGIALDAEVAGQAVGAHAVDEAEVDDLGEPALVRADLLGRDAEDLAGGRP